MVLKYNGDLQLLPKMKCYSYILIVLLMFYIFLQNVGNVSPIKCFKVQIKRQIIKAINVQITVSVSYKCFLFLIFAML